MATEDGEGEPLANSRQVGTPGLRANKPLREIAIDLHGREQVDAGWHADSRMRVGLRWMLQRAKAGSAAGPETA